MGSLLRQHLLSKISCVIFLVYFLGTTVFINGFCGMRIHILVSMQWFSLHDPNAQKGSHGCRLTTSFDQMIMTDILCVALKLCFKGFAVWENLSLGTVHYLSTVGGGVGAEGRGREKWDSFWGGTQPRINTVKFWSKEAIRLPPGVYRDPFM